MTEGRGRPPRRIASATSSRADHGILGRVWQALAEDPGLQLHVVATGMNHVDPAELETLVPTTVDLHWAGADIGGAGARLASDAVARSVGDWAGLIETLDLDLLLLAGDRLDMLPAAVAALPARLPILHIHGGEVTLGAFDEQIRHAISKMSHVHFAALTEAAARLCRMGEEPWRIHVTGSPSIDSLLAMEPLDRSAFFAELGLPATDSLRLVTVHPETNAADPTEPAQVVADALVARPHPTLVTAANSDPGGARIREMFDSLAAQFDWLHLRGSLGTRLYRSALEHAAIMIGNSSSGLIEAPVFGLRVINVGRRQEGRPLAPAITACPNEATSVIAALDALEERRPDHRADASPAYGAYGDGHAAERIAQIVSTLPDRERLLDKTFHDGIVPAFTPPWTAQEDIG